MLTLQKDGAGEIAIKPRWPAQGVYISNSAYARLKDAQGLLQPFGIELILTHGYEKEGVFGFFGHKIGRLIGAAIFFLLYPQRSREIKEIFSPNGHDNPSGNCIDIKVMHEGKTLRLLPYNVFTSQKDIRSISQAHKQILNRVYEALKNAGFLIHQNKTEALQIHYELSFTTS